jgi:hypothetical protein
MNIRSSLLVSAVFLFPIAAPAQARQGSDQPATTSAAATQPAAPSEVGPTPTPTPSQASGGAPVDAEEAPEEQEIVVVGARPRGSVIGDIPPENTLDARDVRATGATNINELLDAIAPQIGSSQGRTSGRPVLLLNGQRISSFREMRDIPTEAIQRVEILPEEVALKYGYSADQKVVNIVLRPRFRSTVAQLGAGGATEGGYANGNVDVTRLMIQKNGRTQVNLHAEGNTMLTEAERNIRLEEGQSPDQLSARSLVGNKADLRGSVVVNRQVLGDVSATLNTEVEHVEGRSLIGLGRDTLQVLGRHTNSDTAHAGLTLNWDKAKWHWNVTGNADWEQDTTKTERDVAAFPLDRAKETTTSGDVTATTNGTLFKLPAGNAGATFRVGASTVNLDTHRGSQGIITSNSLSRTAGNAAVNIDLPISRRGHDFSALGNLTLSANAEINHLSDFGTLTKFGGGANFSPVDRLNFVTSWTREEGAPTINQLGDPLLTTPDVRIFDFTTGQTVEVTTLTGGNPNLLADKRTVFKLGGYWKPSSKTDLTLRADYVHQTIDRPISSISVTPQIEAAFPDRFVRCPADAVDCTPGQLLAVDLRPINFDSSRRDSLTLGFDFSKPLKSRRPSQAVLDQMRQQFGFGARGGATGSSGPTGQAQQGQGRDSSPPPGSPPEGGDAPGVGRPPPGGGGFGGPGGRGGFGGFGRGGNGSRGRLTFSLTDTIAFVDKVTIAPGLDLDYRHGDAAGQTGGTPLHTIQAQGGYFNNGLGARIGANFRTGTDVNTLNGDNLHFSPLATFDLRLFANPGDIPEVVVKHPWLRATQLRFEVTNIFNTRPNVHDATGAVPLNYQADLLNPLGRTVMISFRKLFLPSPSFFRQERQREQQQGQQSTR